MVCSHSSTVSEIVRLEGGKGVEIWWCECGAWRFPWCFVWVRGERREYFHGPNEVHCYCPSVTMLEFLRQSERRLLLVNARALAHLQ